MNRLARYYDWLGRFQRAARWVSGSGDHTLTVHRKLRSERPDVPPHHVVHERLLGVLGGLDDPHVIDAGCGLGGTTFYLHARVGGRYEGITLSPSQHARAQREARRRGVADACRFHIRSYDDALTDLAPAGVDLIVAIESLAHSPNPTATVANLVRVLRPGGLLAIADDVPADEVPDDDADLAGFREGWHTLRLARGTTLEAAFLAAGLEVMHDEDLTSLVLMRNPVARERRARLSGGLLRMLGGGAGGQLLGALHGGMLLERLYARGAMRYKLLVARKARAAEFDVPRR
jgi:SAM-dependent methyltransferase